MFRGTTSIRQMPGALIPDRSSGGSCNGLSRAGLHSIRISSAHTPGDFQQGLAWEAFSQGTPFLEAAARLLLLASDYSIACIIKRVNPSVNRLSSLLHPVMIQSRNHAYNHFNP